MSDLWYRAGIHPPDLDIGECTIFFGPDNVWLLAFCFRRRTDGKRERRLVPVTPNGDAQLGVTWGLRRIEAGRWQVSPSLQCIDRIPSAEAPGYKDIEEWHETPTINGVPEEEPWCVVGAFKCGTCEGKPETRHIGAGTTIDVPSSTA